MKQTIYKGTKLTQFEVNYDNKYNVCFSPKVHQTFEQSVKLLHIGSQNVVHWKKRNKC